MIPTIPKRALVYLDPPYYLKGKGLYEHHYEHDDHAGIAKKVRKIKQSWIVSYDNVPQNRALYAAYRSVTFGLRYSSQSRYAASDIMFSPDGMTLPSTIGFGQATCGERGCTYV